MKKITVLLALALGFAGCNNNKEASLEAQIKGLGNDTVYLYDTDGIYNRIDTIYVENDRFTHTLQVDTTATAILLFKGGTEYPIFIEKGSQLKIQGEASKLDFLTVEGNASNEEFKLFQSALKALGTSSEKRLQEKAEEFIRQHNTSPVSLYLLNKYFIQKPFPDYARIKELTSTMSGVLQDNPTIQQLDEFIGQWERTKAGSIAPYFNLPNTKETMVARGSAFKDQFLLITFWASWSEECQKANAELRKINRIYKKSKNFGMLGLSLDIDKEAWKQAIKKDTLKWEQVCDFTGLNGETTRQYAITKLPTHLLLFPNGVIAARDFPTDSIHSEIKKILKNDKK